MKRKLCRNWGVLIIAIFDVLEGCKSSKLNPWRLRAILLSVVIMVLLSIFMLYYKVTLVYPHQSLVSALPDALQIVNDALQYIIDLYYVNKNDKSIYSEYYRQYVIIDSFLKRQPEPEVNKKLARLIGIFLLIWFTNFVMHVAAVLYEFIPEFVLIILPFHLFVLHKMLTLLYLSAHTIRIERRLKMVGDLVEDCYDMDCSWQNINAVNEYTKLTARIRSSPEAKQEPTKYLSQYQQKKVAGLSKLYLILTEQSELVNSMYGIRMLLLSLNLTIDMVRFINSMYRYVSGQEFSRTTYPMATASLARTLTCMAMLFSLMHHCERAYRQTDRIVRLCDRVLITSGSEAEVQAAVSELRELVISRPVSFNVAHFFRLEYPALTGIAATVVSYSIILFQS